MTQGIGNGSGGRTGYILDFLADRVMLGFNKAACNLWPLNRRVNSYVTCCLLSIIRWRPSSPTLPEH